MKIKFSKKQKRILFHIIAGLICFIIAIVFPYDLLSFGKYMRVALYIIAYIVTGFDVIKNAFKKVISGDFLDEDFLMLIASIGAMVIGEFSEGVEVLLLFLVGELFENVAVSESRKQLSDLMNIRPDKAAVFRNGEYEIVEPKDVKIDEIIKVSPGERIPIDGIVIKGSTSLDTSSLTGESMPREIKCGDEILSGCVVLDSVIEIQVKTEYSNSTVSRILDLVENAYSSKAKSERFISKFARVYTPVVVAIAVLVAIIPSLFSGMWSVWVYRALSFLVISCPCAVVISVPLAYFCGLGYSSKKGILIKGSNYLEALSNAKIVVTDKTGTLTRGICSVTNIVSYNIDKEQLLEYVAYAENSSSHPIAKAIVDKYGKEISDNKITDLKEMAGKGIKAEIDGKTVCVGKYDFISECISDNIENINSTVETAVYVAIDNVYSGYITFSDEIKENALESISMMKKNGIDTIIMLTGDNEKTAENVSKELSIDKFFCNLLPQNKVEHMKKIIAERNKNDKVIFIGDGINDAPVIALADIGIAMGKLGCDAAIEAADVVITDDNLMKISTLMRIAHKTKRIVYENIIFALSVKLLVLVLTAFGVVGMQAAVFADVGVSMICICNSLRNFIGSHNIKHN